MRLTSESIAHASARKPWWIVGSWVVAIVVSIVPFLFPAVLQGFGLLIGLIQAYVFGMLALVYVLSAVRSHSAERPGEQGGAAGRNVTS